ncbi:MAG: excisionase family DNA binding protein [Gammaproteobacteria bacterium]|jgi:excisionase family DNA binding protein
MKNTLPKVRPALLNIGEAAEMLRVSEVSLRRWTDSGALHCERVGGRRERRFREADLLAFLEQQAGSSTKRNTKSHNVSLGALAIPYGKHVCAFYSSRAGRDKLAIPFLVEGLARGEACYVVAVPEVRELLASAVREVYPEYDQALAAGAWRAISPSKDPIELLAFFTDEFMRVTRRSFVPVRVLGDMAGFVHQGATTRAVLDFERQFDLTLAHKYPVISLCQYDAREFSGVDVVGALECHGDIFEFPLRNFLGE